MQKRILLPLTTLLVGSAWAFHTPAVNAQPVASAPASPLGPIVSKSTFTDDEKTRVEQRVQDLVAALPAPGTKDITAARNALVAELTSGTPQFRDLAAAFAGKELLQLMMGSKFDLAHEASLALVGLDNAATRDALVSGLGSRFSGVKYDCARGLLRLAPQLKDRAAFDPVLQGLAQAGEREADPIVLRTIYRAANFCEKVQGFAGGAEVAGCVNRILSARLERDSGGSSINWADDIQGFRTAFRLAGVAPQPPVALMRTLAHVLQNMAQKAIATRGAVPIRAVEECEEAIRQLMSKYGKAAGFGKLADVIRNGADAKKIGEGLAEYIGGSGKTGALNAAPWNLPTALAEKTGG